MRNEALFQRARSPSWTWRTTGKRSSARRRGPSGGLRRPGIRQIPGTGSRCRKAWNRRRTTRIKEGCYELLLILAEAPTSLTRACGSLAGRPTGPATQVYHLLARPITWPGAVISRRRTGARAKPKLAADLLGPRSFLERQGTVQDDASGGRHARTSTRRSMIQPDHFWAHCLSAICSLQLCATDPAQGRAQCLLAGRTELRLALRATGLRLVQGRRAGAGRLTIFSTTGRTLSGEIQSHLKAAEADFTRALELLEAEPNDEVQYVLLVNRALLRFERRDWNKAVADWSTAIRLDEPRAGTAVEALAQVYVQARQARSRPSSNSRRAITLQTRPGPALPRSSRC